MTHGPASLALLFIVLLLVGCDESKDSSRSADGKAPAAAAPDDYLHPKQAAVTQVALVPPAAKPTGALAKDASCITPECHANFTRAAHVHGPISEKACNACHADDVGGHRYP